MIKFKLKKLKDVNDANVRKAIEHTLQYQLNQWISPRRMMAQMWTLTAYVSEEKVKTLMEDIYIEALDSPLNTYIKDKNEICYKCVACTTPN